MLTWFGARRTLRDTLTDALYSDIELYFGMIYLLFLTEWRLDNRVEIIPEYVLGHSILSVVPLGEDE